MAPLSHDRAQLIEGWDQRKVARGQVVLCSTTTHVTWDLFWLFAGLQGMGFRTFLAHLPHDDSPPTTAPYWPAATFAQECSFVQPGPLLVTDELSLVEVLDPHRPAVFVAAEPNPRTFATTLMLADALRRPVLLPVANNRQFGLLEVGPLAAAPDRLEAYMRLGLAGDRHPAISLFLAAVVLERIRQILAPLPSDVLPNRPLCVSLGLRGLRARIEEPVYLVGLGGIGAPAALLLMNFASTLILLDHDIAEPSNRARAPWLVPGQPKVHSVAEFARFLASRMGSSSLPKLQPRVEKVTSADFLESSLSPASVVAAVDNWAARALLSQVTVERCRARQQVLLINAGCSPSGASVNPIGGPYGSACLAHRHPDLDLLAAREQAVSCARMPTASILYTNWAAAALAVLSLLAVPEPLSAEYNCQNPDRLYVRRTSRCPCFL